MWEPLFINSGHIHAQLQSGFAIREVALCMWFPRLVTPNFIHFSYHVTTANGHLWNKACSLSHGLPGWKSGCTTTISPESFISLKSKCQPGQKSQGRLYRSGSFCKLSGCSQNDASCNSRTEALRACPPFPATWPFHSLATCFFKAYSFQSIASLTSGFSFWAHLMRPDPTCTIFWLKSAD